MLLADAAQVADGKLYILGGGWGLAGPEPAPSALALHIEVPWDRTNTRHRWRLELLDSDGQPVTAADDPITVEGEIEVGRPAGLTPGTPIGASIALNLAPLPLAPGGRCEWRLTLAGEARDEWRVAFSVRPGS